MSFVPDYLLATSNNESPIAYHKWACLSCLSVLVGRRFWFDLGPFRYYPNFYTVLVGDPGVKKSAAMDVAKDIIRAVGGIPMAATSTTKEAITKMMGHEKYPGKKWFQIAPGQMEEYNQLAIFATEFTTFLGVNTENMIDFLTNIYTEKVYDEVYKNAGNTSFVGPYITMLACMTPQTVKGYLKLNILTGGFARRTMFVWGSLGRPIAFPGNTPEQIEAFSRCVEWGKKVQQESGPFTLTEECKVWWKDWYESNYAKVKDRPPSTQSYFLTKHEFMLKTAMLLVLGNDEHRRVITPADFEFLDKTFFAPNEQNLERVFEGAGINPNAAAAAQVCRMLEALDRPMNKKKLEAMFMESVTDMRALQDTLSHLINVGRLEERTLRVGDQIIGTVIAAPGVIIRYSDVELAGFVRASAPPPPETDTGPSPSTGQ